MGRLRALVRSLARTPLGHPADGRMLGVLTTAAAARQQVRRDVPRQREAAR